MNTLIAFALELLSVSICFYLGFLIIRNHTTPTFKRFYLLCWMILSVLLPNVTIESDQISQVSINQLVEDRVRRPQPAPYSNPELNDEMDFNSIQSDPEIVAETIDPSWNLFEILSTVYLVITGFLLFRILAGLVQIVQLRMKANVMESQGRKLYMVQDPDFKAASFFSWVFIGSDLNNQVVVKHELTHSSLGHSTDILFSHLYCALFWANPFSWILKRLISINTEMEVDAKILKEEKRADYANLLLSISQGKKGSAMMNHFGAFHLKLRIIAITKTIKHKKWVSLFSIVVVSFLFFFISCESVSTSELMVERMSEVKTITTRFISHQSDTQQKTGKVVAIASFSQDGSLEELVQQTSYPYDREFETKTYFWDEPETLGIPFVMDGLSLGEAEKTFLYGNDWPAAYYKELIKKSSNKDRNGIFNEKVTTDNELLPTQIIRTNEYPDDVYIGFGFPDVTDYYEYEDGKVIKVFEKLEYPALEYNDEIREKLHEVSNKNLSEEMKNIRKELLNKSGKKGLKATYTYEGELMTSVINGDQERKFYYENKLLVKSEYIRNGEVINTRLHFYKNGLKDRTEIFNRYNEPEYTITYDYEFW